MLPHPHPCSPPTNSRRRGCLHPNQRGAVVNALAEPVSVVTGPPGTGKSEVVVAMLLNQLLRRQTTLFASKNHQALEAVLPRLNSAVEGGDLIIQTSSRELAQRQNYLAKLQSLLARPPRPDADAGRGVSPGSSRHCSAQQRAALADIAGLEQARKEYETVNAQLEELRKTLPLAVQSDDALAHWPREMTRERMETFETELRRALAPPRGFLQKLWHAIRRNRVEARRKGRARTVAFVSASIRRPDVARRQRARRWVERLLRDVENVGRSLARAGARAKLRAAPCATAAFRRLQSTHGKRPASHRRIDRRVDALGRRRPAQHPCAC